jgi:hypothetical protein
VADVLREAIREKKRNERLKQQLKAMEGPSAGKSVRVHWGKCLIHQVLGCLEGVLKGRTDG